MAALTVVESEVLQVTVLKLNRYLEGATCLTVAPSVVVSRVGGVREGLVSDGLYLPGVCLVPLRVRPDLRSLVRV